MSYEVTIQGGLPNGSGTATERHHVREAVANLYAFLEERGHKMTTAFHDGDPLNYQEPKERDAALKAAQDHYDAQDQEAEIQGPLSSEGKAPPTLETPQRPQSAGQQASGGVADKGDTKK